MNGRAQAGLEYVMAYGWALVLVATVVGILVFVATPPAPRVAFLSNTGKILVKSGSILTDSNVDNVSLILQNTTDSPLRITSVTLASDFSDSPAAGNEAATLNGIPISGSLNAWIAAGGEMHLKNIDAPASGGVNGRIDLVYRDTFGLEASAAIIASGSLGG